MVEPALLLFPVVLLAGWWLATYSLPRALTLTFALVLGAACAVGPWTVRNLQVFDRFVLISTNGGIGLYGANNPRAGGGYFEHWAESDLMKMPELEADREGRRRAIAWITGHPADFAALAYEKNLRFMGDDAVGAYETLKRGRGSESAVVYAAFKTLSNLFWLSYWALLLSCLFASWANRKVLAPSQLLVPAAFLYSFLLHSLAESSGKYHVLMIGVLCVLLPLLAQGAVRPTERGTLT